MEIDRVLVDIGGSGRQQIKYGMMMCLVKMYHPLHTLQYNFVARKTEFSCNNDSSVDEDSWTNNTCPVTCSNVTYSEDTIIAEWDLVCEDNWFSKLTMSSLMLGFLIGSAFLGWAADKIGRKRNFMMSLLGMLLSNLISATTPHFYVYLFSRFLVGLFQAGNILSAVTLLAELVGPAYRGLYQLVLMAFFSIGICLLSLIAYYLQYSWRMLTLTVTIIGIPLLVLQWCLIESPRWLLAQNRKDEAEALLIDIAKGNGKTGKLDFKLRAPTAGSDKSQSSESMLRLLTSPRLILISLILCFCWFTVGGVYYGLTIAAGSMGTDVYTGTALSGVVELPSLLIIYYVIDYHGRRVAMVTLFLLAGVSCVSIRLLSSTLTTYLAMGGKMCIASAFNVAYVCTSEIYATSIRNTAIGFMSALARVGAILAPFIVMLGEMSPGTDFLIFGIISLVGGVLLFWLPETRNKPLPESVKEMLISKDSPLKI